jgi:hypothetical protein
MLLLHVQVVHLDIPRLSSKASSARNPNLRPKTGLFAHSDYLI